MPCHQKCTDMFSCTFNVYIAIRKMYQRSSEEDALSMNGRSLRLRTYIALVFKLVNCHIENIE